MMKKMREIPPNSFQFGNKDADIPFNVFIDDNKLLKWMLKNPPIGYNKNPNYRGEFEGYTAILFSLPEENYAERWNHIPDRVFNKYQLLMEK